MRITTGLCTALLFLAGVMPVHAQRAGAVEIGAFGRFTKFESKLNFDDRLGVGGRLGVFLVPNLAVEGDVTYTRTKSQGGLELRNTPIHARLIYNIPVTERTVVLVGAGYVRNIFRANYRETNSGIAGLLGARLGLGDLLALRVDATGDYIPTAESATVPPQVAGVQQKKSNFHLGVEAGLSLLLRAASRDGDRDRDGVNDSIDACPGTPAGDAVDGRGCSLSKDADRDGVNDSMDACPGTPAGDAVDGRGCSLPKDADGDGVVDADDNCPDTPAGTAVDARGCPSDSDGDGVMNAYDNCPNTPAGTSVDANGCTSLFQAGQPLILLGVNFETGKAVLAPESRDILDQVAQSLMDNMDVNVEVGGHTDNTGRAATNMRLSEARANAVRDYLISKGVNAGRITAMGYGQDQPVADNATAAGRAANRRVELVRTN